MKARTMLLLAALMMAQACDAASDAEPAEAAGSKASAEGPDAESAVKNPRDNSSPGAAPAAGKMGGPVSVTYRIIGRPVVGEPLNINLQVSSALGDLPVRIDYRILDGTALRLADSQAPFTTVAAKPDDGGGTQQVTIVPLREGRLYLNVAASVDTSEGTVSTVTAIPIQVGNAPRETRENGTLATDADGETVRVLRGSEEGSEAP